MDSIHYKECDLEDNVVLAKIKNVVSKPRHLSTFTYFRIGCTRLFSIIWTSIVSIGMNNVHLILEFIFFTTMFIILIWFETHNIQF